MDLKSTSLRLSFFLEATQPYTKITLEIYISGNLTKNMKNMELGYKFLPTVIFILENMIKEFHRVMESTIGIVEHFIEDNFYQE